MNESEARPNILLIMSDEHAPQLSSMHGYGAAQSPNLWRLADEGVTFERAYCNSPLCVPSRMSFMAGQYVHQIAAWDNGTALDSNIVTWAHLARGAGYDTVLSGKQHFIGPDQLHGFREQLALDLHSTRHHPIYDWDDGVLPASSPWEDKQTPGPGATKEVAADEAAAAAAVSFIRDKATSERPWLLNASFIAPHFPLVAPERYWDAYDEDRIDLPEIPSGHLEALHPVIAQLRAHFGTGSASTSVTRRLRRGYYALISFLDQLVGQLLEALTESGQADNTIVIYTSDHGEMAGEHGLWRKSNFYEYSSRVPLIIRYPNRIRPGTRVSSLVSLVDLSATLVELAGRQPPAWWPGRSLQPLWSGEVRDSFVFSEYTAHGVDAPVAMIREANYKLNWYFGYGPELYDLAIDPGEFEDLSESPQHSSVRARLAGRLLSFWDPVSIYREVKRSQRERLTIRNSVGVDDGPASAAALARTVGYASEGGGRDH